MKSNLIQFFQYKHLPPNLAEVSEPFCGLAEKIDLALPDNPEKTTALRKLLEAKDCAVRAVLFKAVAIAIVLLCSVAASCAAPLAMTVTCTGDKCPAPVLMKTALSDTGSIVPPITGLLKDLQNRKGGRDEMKLSLLNVRRLKAALKTIGIEA